MRYLPEIFDNNRQWAEAIKRERPDYLPGLDASQAPRFLWIGCSDSRVPANEICGLQPGEMFKHRNIANLVRADDPNCLAVIQFAVHTLKVRHIVVCGHYRCGGVHAAMGTPGEGALDEWLSPVRQLGQRERRRLADLDGEEKRWNRLCELNVMEQVRQLATLPLITQAWDEGRRLSLHGWMYEFHTGLLHDLGMSTSGPAETLPS
jgi:carbonic anhydrase